MAQINGTYRLEKSVNLAQIKANFKDLVLPTIGYDGMSLTNHFCVRILLPDILLIFNALLKQKTNAGAKF